MLSFIKPRLTKSAALVSATAICWCCTCLVAEAQQIGNSPTPPVLKTLTDVATDLERRLQSMGYTNIRLSTGARNITGTATKDGRQVHIVFDEKGLLHIE
jgi:hypothetical protein